MRLQYQHEFLSIKSVPDIELPNLVVIHGANGAGKTHLLRAIEDRAVMVFDQDRELTAISYANDFIGSSPFIHHPRPEGTKPPVGTDGHIHKILTSESAAQEVMLNLFSVDELSAMKTVLKPHEYLTELFDKLQKSDESIVSELENIIRRAATSNKKDMSDAVFRYLSSSVQNIRAMYADVDIEYMHYIKSGFLNPSVGQLFYNYWMAFRRHRNLQIVGKMNDKYQESDNDFFLKYGNPPWLAYNDWLIDFGLDFSIGAPSLESTHYGPVNLCKISTGERINLESLSSGEIVYLNLALATMATNDNNINVQKPDLILLDEPDAHLHPALAKDLFEKILIPLVNTGYTRVILTTHSPTTVAVAPADAIYQKLVAGGLCATSRQQAVDSLLVGVPHLALDPSGRRQVFVESKADQYLFERLYDIVRPKILSERSLTFLSVGYQSRDGEANAGKDRVKQFVNRLREAGNNSVFGLIDWDNVENETTEIQVLGKNHFYSIENILLNPLLVGALIIKFQISLGAKYKFINMLAASQVEKQKIIDDIEEVMGGCLLDDKTDVNLIGGDTVKINSRFCAMNGHAYEKLIIDAFPGVNKALMSSDKSLTKAIVNQVIAELDDWCPQTLVDTFRQLSE